MFAEKMNKQSWNRKNQPQSCYNKISLKKSEKCPFNNEVAVYTAVLNMA